jgi:hypothetical protein
MEMDMSPLNEISSLVSASSESRGRSTPGSYSGGHVFIFQGGRDGKGM